MADADNTLNINLIGRDSATAVIKAFQRQIDDLNSRMAQVAVASIRYGASSKEAFEASARAIGSVTKELQTQIDAIKVSMTTMADVVTRKNNEAIASIRALATEQRALASIRPAAGINVPLSGGRSIRSLTPPDELIYASTGLAAAQANMARNIHYKNEDAIATSRQAAAERDAAAAAEMHSRALAAENANLLGRINAITGVSRAAAADSVFGAAMGRGRGGRATGGRTSAFGNVEGEEGQQGFFARMFSRPQEIRHLVAAPDELMRGQRGAFFATLGAMARDAGFGVGALATSFGVLATVMGGAAIIKGEENVAKLAEDIKAGAAANGMSIEQYSGLRGALELTGTKANEADASLRHLAQTTGQALADPNSKAAQAFHNLGVSQDKLEQSGGNVMNVLKLLSSALQNDTNQTNIAQNATELLGHGTEKLLSILQDGPSKFDALVSKGYELVGMNKQQAESAVETGEKLHEMGMKISGEVDKAMIAWGPTIVSVVGFLTELGGAISGVLGLLGKLVPASKEGGNALADIATGAGIGAGIGAKVAGAPGALIGGAVGATPELMKATGQAQGSLIEQQAKLGFIVGEGGAVVPLDVPEAGKTTQAQDTSDAAAEGKTHDVPALGSQASFESDLALRVSQAKLQAAQTGKSARDIEIAGTKASIAALQNEINTVKMSATEKANLQSRVNNETVTLLREEATADAAAAKQSYADYASSEKQKIAIAKETDDGTLASAQKTSVAIQAIYKEWALAAKTTFGQVASVVNNINTDAIKAAKQGADEQAHIQIRNIEQQAQATEALAHAQRNSTQMGLMSQGKKVLGDEGIQAYQADQKSALETLNSQLSVYQQIMNSSEVTEQVRQEAAQKTIQVYDQQTSRIIQDQKQIQSAVNQANQEMKRTFEDLFNSMGSAVNKFGEDFLKAVIAPQQELIKAGLTTIHVSLRGQEMRQALGGLATSFASSIAGAVQTGLSRVAASGLSKMFNLGLEPGAGLGGAFGGMIGKAFGFGTNTSSTQTLQAAGTSLQQAATQLQQAASMLSTNGGAGAGGGNGPTGIGGGGGGGEVTKPPSADANAITSGQGIQTSTLMMGLSGVGSIVSSAVGGSAGKIISGLIGVLELIATLMIALNVKPSILGTTYSGGGIVSAAGGMTVGGLPGSQGQVAVLHSKEMVLPRHLSEGVQSAINGGGLGNSRGGNSAHLNYAPTFNMPGGQRNAGNRAQLNQLLASNAGSLAGIARGLIRDGWRG